MTRFLAPPDTPDVVYEFFSPFAHVEGHYEWCRIRSPTHGVFDTFILIDRAPVTVYVASRAGEVFMRERYPECRTHRVPEGNLVITESHDGRIVTGVLRATEGPVRDAIMTLAAEPDALPEAIPYGGQGKPVWGSRFTCWGVDLVLRGKTRGTIRWAEGATQQLEETPCLVTLGSFGRIAPLPARGVPAAR